MSDSHLTICAIIWVNNYKKHNIVITAEQFQVIEALQLYFKGDYDLNIQQVESFDDFQITDFSETEIYDDPGEYYKVTTDMAEYDELIYTSESKAKFLNMLMKDVLNDHGTLAQLSPIYNCYEIFEI